MHVTEEIVRFSDTDAAGILYFGSFATYFDESFLSALREEGIGWDEHKTYNFLLPIIEHKTNFYAPLKFGEKVRVYCSITKVGRTSFTSSHLLQRVSDGVICAQGYISRVVVDYNTFQKKEIPNVLKKIFEKLQTVPEGFPEELKQKLFSVQ